METTKGLKLKITTQDTFKSDDVKETITEYGNNFKTLEKEIAEAVDDISSLEVGRLYKRGEKVWNSYPSIDDYIGWVNIREGVYAHEWSPLSYYSEGDIIRAKPDNGNIYKCISGGRASNSAPNFLTSSGVEFNDARGDKWRPEYNYEANDIVFATNGSQLFYFVCETAGLSSEDEPSWSNIVNGTTTIDGSVVWRKEKTIKWKQIDVSCNFRTFGKIE